MSKVTISLKQPEIEEAIIKYVRDRVDSGYGFVLEDFEVEMTLAGQERRIECEVSTEVTKDKK